MNVKYLRASDEALSDETLRGLFGFEYIYQSWTNGDICIMENPTPRALLNYAYQQGRCDGRGEILDEINRMPRFDMTELIDSETGMPNGE